MQRAPVSRHAQKAKGRFRRVLDGALPGLLVTLALLLLSWAHAPAVAQLGNMIFDAYQRAHPRPYRDAPVQVVDIDDETIARLGQWPWPRTDVARLTRALADAGAAAIAFDIVFSEPDRTSPARAAEILRRNPEARGDYRDIAALADHDAILAKTLSETPSVAGLFLTREANRVRPPQKAGFAMAGSAPTARLPAFNGSIIALPGLSGGAAGNGFVTITGAGDGIIRATPLLSRIGDQLVPSLALEALRVAQGAGAVVVKSSNASGEGGGGGEAGVVAVKVGEFEAPTTRSGELWLHYTRPRPERIVPAWKILTGALPPAEMQRLFMGKIVFVGTGASGLRDLVATPVQDRELGVVVHAQAAEQIILGDFLSRPDWAPGLERTAMLVLGVALAFALPFTGSVFGGMAAAAAVAGIGFGSWLGFRNGGLLIDPTYPVLGVAGAYTAGTLYAFYREERARAYIRNAFDRYLSPELVARIARDPGQLELGGEEREMTVLFCDIRSFSRISETLAPKQTIGFLIDFLTPMTDALLARKATIDKYIGDAILAFWNAPLDDPDHPRNAALAALDMVDRLAELNAAAAAGANPLWPGKVRIGIGINTGPCCVGNMGSRQRLSYSLIGDTVNLSSRIEGLTKLYGVQVAVGEALARRLQDFALVELDIVRVVGRETPERVYALLGPPALQADPGFQALEAAQAALLAAFRSGDWAGAEAALARQRAAGAAFGLDKLSDLYAGRIAAFRATAPAAGWDGVFEAQEK